MGYYDPSMWIGANDRLLADVEGRMQSDKRARSGRSGSGKSFLPPSSLQLDIIVTETEEVLRLTERLDKLGRVRINLFGEGVAFRKGHFNETRWHHNPDDRNIPPPHHNHFPTSKYPNLDRPHTYAHPVRADSDCLDFLNALRTFCEYVNIELHGVSLPLLRR
jgi:hypothetical protein